MGGTRLASAQIDSAATPSLSYIRASSTSRSPAIRPRQDTSHHRVEALEVIPGLFIEHWFFHTFLLHYCNIGVNIL